MACLLVGALDGGGWLQTSEAERIGVDQVAKILPTGATSGSSQREAGGGRGVREGRGVAEGGASGSSEQLAWQLVVGSHSWSCSSAQSATTLQLTQPLLPPLPSPHPTTPLPPPCRSDRPPGQHAQRG